jgi:RHS repeat-associated protein
LADFGFTGFYYDQASGLWFSQSRAYDPNLARWLSRDPIGEAGGINLYAYVSNNPTDLIDPSGLAGMPPNSPPFPVPGGGPGNGWKWNPNPKYDPSAPSSRPGSYGPEEPVPNPQGGQPITSWDDQTPNPHWDLNDGNGNKSWMDNKGNPITSDDAHGRCPPKEEPEPEPKPKVPWWAPFELPGEFLGPWIFIPPGYHTPGKPDLNRQA